MDNQLLSEAQVLTDARLTKNKLLSMKDHLETLLRKRIRLNSEILILQKAIKNKEKNFVMKIKTGVQLESSDRPFEVFEPSEGEYLIGTPGDCNLEVFQAIQEVCDVSQDIKSLCLEFQESTG